MQPQPFDQVYKRGYTGHEHIDNFALINMNGRMYDPRLGRFLSPDPYVQAPDYTQSYNRYSYCVNNPMKFTDPSGEFFIVDSWIIGLVHGFFSTDSHRGRAALREANLRAGNDARIWGGLFTSDKNKPWHGQVWEVVSRFTWQLPQTVVGFLTVQTANYFGAVDRVEYYGGATFCIDENRGKAKGVSIGNFIKIKITDEIEDNFIQRLRTDPLFMHEYGHYIDSQIFGISYLLVIGIPSLITADLSSQAVGEPRGVKDHNFYWYERRANRNAAKHFNVDWTRYELYFPRLKR